MTAATEAAAGSLEALGAAIDKMMASPPSAPKITRKPTRKTGSPRPRRRMQAPQPEPPEPTEMELLQARERVLAERVREEQLRTRKERPQCFAMVELERVRLQLADPGVS